MIETAIQIFFLLNPLTATPILFLAYKKKFDVRKMAIGATILAFVIAIAFIFLGPLLLRIFGISVDSVRAAGGILIILLGLSMAGGSDADENTKVTTSDALTSLLSTPMLTGPATLSYLSIKTAEIGAMPLVGSTVLAFVVVGAVFVGIVQVMPNINLKYIDLTSRVFGLFLLALGVEMLAAAAKAMLF